MSEKTDIKLFELLKKEVAQTLLKNYPGNNDDIGKWKGQEIKCFQEDLIEKVQGRISEKWFYTHLKSPNNTIPRIDILNLLCRYCDYEDWIDFKAKNQIKTKGFRKWKYFSMIAVVLILASWFAFSTRYYEYEIEILDAFTLEPIRNDKLEVYWLREGESPQHFHELQEGRLILNTDNRNIKLVIKAPYYFTDTIERKIPYKKWNEKIPLQPDDYSMMIRYFSESDVEEWDKRREKLRDIFSFNATIFQVNENGTGMAVYNQDEFINKLSFPIGQLKNIEILDTRISKEKIVYLRFKIEGNEMDR